MFRRTPLCLLAALLVAAVLPSSASAASAAFSGGVLTITGTESTDQIKVSESYHNSSYWVGVSDYPRNIAAPGGCTQKDATEFVCPLGSVHRIVANLNGGNDAYSNYHSGIEDVVDGGGGNDEITGAVAGDDAGDEAVDTISGGAGNDVVSAGSGSGSVVNGGEGDDDLNCYYVPAGGTCTLNGDGGKDDLDSRDSNDVLNGGPGDEVRITGGAGNDVIDGGDGNDGVANISDGLRGGPGADDIRGGPGIDELMEDRNDDVTQYWSLDDVANDGADADGNGAAEEGDNVHSDVENVVSGFDDDVIVGSAANNKVFAGTLGDDLVIGNGGDDDLNGGVSGTDKVDGGAGNDKVAGNGHLLGGPGNDELIGYGDNGLQEPGPGIDSVSAGDGNDVVRSADGEVDTIGCGVGADIAEVDQLDVVNTKDDGDNCEQVKKTTVSPVTPGGQDATGNPNAGAVALILGRTASLSGSNAVFGATAPGPGIIKATVTAATAGKASASARKKPVLGTAMVAVAKAGKVSIKVKLKGSAFKKLKRKKSFKVKLTTVFTPIGGKAGPAQSKTVTIKRKK